MTVEIAAEKHDDGMGLPEGDGKEQLPAAALEPDPVDADGGGQEELKDESGDDSGTLSQRMTMLMKGYVYAGALDLRDSLVAGALEGVGDEIESEEHFHSLNLEAQQAAAKVLQEYAAYCFGPLARGGPGTSTSSESGWGGLPVSGRGAAP